MVVIQECFGIYPSLVLF